MASCAPQTPGMGARPAYPSNVIAIDQNDAILFNGESITLEGLQIVLEEVAQMEPQPDVQLEPDARASYEMSAQVLRVIKKSGVTKFGFVGNEKYRTNEAAPD